jgi:hypothetical protein
MVSGDLKEEIRGHLLKELTQVTKAMDEHGEKPNLLSRQKAIEYQLDTLDAGIDRPFLAMSGYTTEKNFNDLVTFENTTTGFIGRSILCIEQDTAPPTKKNWKKLPMPEGMKLTLQRLSAGGSYDLMERKGQRVENYGDRIEIPTTAEALAMLDNIVDLFDQMAYDHKESTGLEALPLRGYEQVSKVSLILAIPEGVRTVEHVRWAYGLVQRDIQSKMRLVLANDSDKSNPERSLLMTILQMVDGQDGETAGVIMRRLERKYKREDVAAALARLVQGKKISEEITIHKYNKQKSVRYKLIHS